MVIAGPGSGKTHVIIQRILYLIKHHQISPNEILVITFTKAAALEMKERYEAVFSEKNFMCGQVNFGTFHSICYHILQRSGGFSPQSLISEIDKRNIMQIILANHGYAENCSQEEIFDILSVISRYKNLKNMDDCIGQQCKVSAYSKEEISVFINEYQQQLSENKKLDFDDMIEECYKLLNNNPDILEQYRNQFRFIMVDEFQDINLSQYEVVKLLTGGEENIFVVGDDDQSIYGFRGAHPGIMQAFSDDYPKCKKIMLTENYRSGECIVRLAEKMIGRNTVRICKEFIPRRKDGEINFLRYETRKDEEKELTSKVKELSKDEIINSAVILRTNREVVRYREILKSAGIMVKEMRHSDNDIFHGFIIEDISAFLCFVFEGRRRKDFLRIMNKPEHYFTRLAINGEIVKKEDMKNYYYQNQEMKKKVEKFFGQIEVASTLTPYMAVSFFRKSIGYDNYLKKKSYNHQEFKGYMAQIERIHELLKHYNKRINIADYFREKEEEQGRCTEKKKAAEGISVITMHGAKGLEFDHVFLPDVNEGVIPEKKCTTLEELEEERRLLYVAITRAKNHLHIYCTEERNRKPSSFLEGIILPQ